MFLDKQVEEFNKPTLEGWRKYDDGRDLSTYDFKSDELSQTKDEVNNQKLAYRHRWISNLYLQVRLLFIDQEKQCITFFLNCKQTKRKVILKVNHMDEHCKFKEST